MSSVSIVYPKHRLAAQLKAPGGPAVADALLAAQANLDELKPQCLSELQALVRDAEACLARIPATFSAEPLKALYAIASRGIGAGSVCGAAGADKSLVSLCDLLDHLITAGRLDREAVAVHVRTLQFLVSGQETPAAAVDMLLGQLRKVSARYAVPPPLGADG
jgi:hypothetical protein